MGTNASVSKEAVQVRAFNDANNVADFGVTNKHYPTAAHDNVNPTAGLNK